MLQRVLLAAAVAIAAVAASPFTVQWSTQLPYPASGASMVSAVGAGMYFTTDVNGTVYGVNTTSHKVQWSLRWDDLAFLQVIPSMDGLLVAVQEGSWMVKASTGQIIWVNNTVQVSANTAQETNFVIDGTTMLATVQNQQTFSNSLVAYDLKTAATLWTNANIQTVPTVSGNGVGIASGQDANYNTIVSAIDLLTGTSLWSRQVQALLTANAHTVAVSNMSTNYSYFNPDLLFLNPKTGANQRTIHNVSGLNDYQVTAKIDGDIFVWTDEQSFIAALSLTTGMKLWSTNFGYGAFPSGIDTMTVHGNYLVAQTNNNYGQIQLFNLTAFNFQTGAQSWTIMYPPTTQTGTVVYFGQYVYIPNLEGYTLWSVITGKLVSVSYSGNSFIGKSVQQGPGGDLFATTPGGLVEELAPSA